MIAQIYGRIVGAGSDAAKSIADEARNGFLHIGSLSLTKVADGLVDPKLVLSWLLGALGSPAYLIGLLVPIREAGALLPQLALAGPVSAAAQRKWFWITGSAIQGFAALGIVWAALFLDGFAAGVAIVGFLALLSLARAACSVSQKDALARTVKKTHRGAISGMAATAAAIVTLAFGAGLASGLIPLTTNVIAGVVAVAGAAWISGALLFSFLSEPKSEPEDEDGPTAASLVKPLFNDAHLRRFIMARALLTATALAPPFIVLLSTSIETTSGLGTLGPLVLASAAASILSGYIWGRLSDVSSRLTLATSAGLGGLTLTVAGCFGVLTGSLGGLFGAAAALFISQIAYEGVRAGRKLHLTDMADDASRAKYTALSNTLVGLVLVVGGALGFLATWLGPAWVLIVFGLLCLIAVPAAMSLEEVQEEA